MAKYTVLSPLKLVDRVALDGDVIDLDDCDALELLAAGVIAAAADSSKETKNKKDKP